MTPIGRFQLTAHPKLTRKSTEVELDHVEFNAFRDGEEARTWVVQGHELGVLFDILASPELATELICDLRNGRSVTFPGDYNAIQSVLLGFRVPRKKAPQRVSVYSTYASARR